MINVLKRAAAADPAKRFANGTAFANALADFLPRAKTARSPRAQPYLFPLMAFFAIVLLLLIGGGIVYFSRAFESPESVAVETTVTPSPTPANATRAPGVGNLPAGPLQIEFFKLNLSADCGGQVETGLSKGGQPLKGAEVSFDFAANNAPASILQAVLARAVLTNGSCG